jgi:hypothetical protein
MSNRTKGKIMDSYSIKVTVPTGESKELRVRGESEAQAIMGAYDYLARQYDGQGEVHEDTLTKI